MKQSGAKVNRDIPTIVGLVPMRRDSERVKGKNYRSLGGKPLFHHVVESLEACPYIDSVVIDTDSTIIAEDARANFPSVKILDRPVHLRDGATPMNDVLMHDVSVVEADYYLQTHSTNPLLRPSTITRAIEAFLSNTDKHDSLFGVTRIQARLWDQHGEAINHDAEVLLRTQDLPPVYEENSNLYIFDAATLRSRHNRIGLRPLIFEIDRAEAWDIDEELDWKIVEFLYHLRNRQVVVPTAGGGH
jgi:CMP-N-acetylneuraminic acid synthetase